VTQRAIVAPELAAVDVLLRSAILPLSVLLLVMSRTGPPAVMSMSSLPLVKSQSHVWAPKFMGSERPAGPSCVQDPTPVASETSGYPLVAPVVSFTSSARTLPSTCSFSSGVRPMPTLPFNASMTMSFLELDVPPPIFA